MRIKLGADKTIADRTSDIEFVSNFCSGHAAKDRRCLILKTVRDSGLTTFLEYMAKSQDQSFVTVYVNCTGSDPEAIYKKFFSNIRSQRGIRLLAASWKREIGTVILQMIGAFISLVPFYGRPAGVLVAGVGPKIFFTHYPSENAEHFADTVTSHLWNKEVVFFIDNAQKLDPPSLNIFRLTHSTTYQHVRYVLGYVDQHDDDEDAFENFRLKFAGAGYTPTVHDFTPPDEIFVKELAEWEGIDLSKDKCVSLLALAKRNVNRLVELLRDQNGSSVSSPCDPLQIEVLRYLFIAKQPLQSADILALLMRSPRIMIRDDRHLGSCVEYLERSGYILRSRSDGHHQTIELISQSKQEVREIANSPILNFPAANELYLFFSEFADKGSQRHAPSSYFALLYRLASYLHPERTPELAVRLIGISLGQGDLEQANQYIQFALPKLAEYKIADYCTLLAFYVSVREFGQAKIIIEKIGASIWSTDRHLAILHAIIANRSREHQLANQEFTALLKSPDTTPEEWALLTSYQVAGLLHEGDYENARRTFERNRTAMKGASNYAYALRNCASAYFWGDGSYPSIAQNLLTESIRRFEAGSDEFGRLTALTNYGACIAVQRTKESALHALPYFKESYMGLCRFGTHHLDESGANYAISLMITGSSDEAKILLAKLSAIISHDFPLVLIRSALAVLELKDGNADKAWEIMHDLSHKIVEVKLPEAIFRGAYNAALVAGVSGQPRSIIQKYLNMARQSGFDSDRRQLDDLETSLNDNDITPENIIDYFSYDHFQYWSQNPLSVIAQPNLPL